MKTIVQRYGFRFDTEQVEVIKKGDITKVKPKGCRLVNIGTMERLRIFEYDETAYKKLKELQQRKENFENKCWKGLNKILKTLKEVEKK